MSKLIVDHTTQLKVVIDSVWEITVHPPQVWAKVDEFLTEKVGPGFVSNVSTDTDVTNYHGPGNYIVTYSLDTGDTRDYKVEIQKVELKS